MSVRHHVQPGEMSAERAMRLWIEAANRHHGLDPLYRRRLRGVVVNRFVATREVAVPPGARAGRMGAVGRACLYASFALALSVGSAMAASAAAIPGDALYPLKRQIEDIREAVVPARFHDELAAHAFAQRTHELGRLLEAGDLARATALLPEVRASYERMIALRPEGAGVDGMVSIQLSILNDLLDQLPPQASDAIRRALENAPGLNGEAPRGGSDEAPGRPSEAGPKGTPAAPAGAEDPGDLGPVDDPRAGSGGPGPDEDADRGRSPAPSSSPEAPEPIDPDDEDG